MRSRDSTTGGGRVLVSAFGYLFRIVNARARPIADASCLAARERGRYSAFDPASYFRRSLDGDIRARRCAAAQRRSTPSSQRGLGLYDSTMVVVGSMIGSGIFIVSADMARQVGSPGWLLVAWLVTGVLTVAAALSYGELAAMMPRAGGQYVYLREAFSPLWGFLYGWTLFLVIQTGTIAAVAVGVRALPRRALPVIARGPLPDPARPPDRRLRGVAVDGAAGRRAADRAAHLDQHARARVRQDRPERLHDGEDRRAGRADLLGLAARLERQRPSRDNFGNFWTPRGAGRHRARR